jgi:hypothetical protein
MAPADLRKEGAAYDLTLAMGILAASKQIAFTDLAQYMIMGERNASYSIFRNVNVFTSEAFNSSRYQVASGYSFTDIDFKFIMDPNPLNFRPSGWVQGNKFKLIKEGLTFWLRNDQTIDSTWHTHAYNNRLVNHSHDHHIKDKPRKTRKFVVRCVKE